MPIYSVQGPDGRIYDVEGPEGASQADIIAAVRRSILMQSAAPKTETTAGGQVKEFLKGVPSGAIGLLESAAIGASALLPDETEAAARRTIADVAGAAKKPFAAAPGYEETIPRKLGEAAGSTGPFLAAGPFGLAGRVGAAALGAGAGAGEARTRAEREGGEEAKGAATALGTVVGLSEMFAPMRILGRLEEPVKAGAVAAIRRALVAGGEEAAQETASQIAQNLIAKGLYKPDQSIIEQVGESAAYGGATGAMIQGLLDLAVGRRAKGAAPAQDAIQRMHAEEEARKEAERARRETPEYAMEVGRKYTEMKTEYDTLRKELKKPGTGASFEEQAKYKEDQERIKELNKTLTKLRPEYQRIKATYEAKPYSLLRPEDLAAAEQKQQAAELAAAPLQFQQTQPYEMDDGQRRLFEFAAPAEAAPEEQPDYAAQARNLEGRLNDLRTQAQATTSLDEKVRLGDEYAKIDAAFKEATDLAKQQTAASPEQKIASLRRKMAVAEENGDIPAQVKLAQQLKELGITDLREPVQGEFPMVPLADLRAASERRAAETEARKTAAEFEQRQQDLVAQRTAPLADPLALYRQSQAQVEDLRNTKANVIEQRDLLQQYIEKMKAERDKLPSRTEPVKKYDAQIAELEASLPTLPKTGAAYNEYAQKLKALQDARDKIAQAPKRAEYDDAIKKLEQQVEELRLPAEVVKKEAEEPYVAALAGKKPVIDIPENLVPLRNAARVRETVTKLFADYNQTQEDYAAAMRANKLDAAKAAYERGNALLEQLNSMANVPPAGTLTKGLKAPPAEKIDAAPYAKELIDARRAQAEALDRAEDALDRLVRGEVLGGDVMGAPDQKMAATSAPLLAKKAEDARAAYVQAVLREAAVTRRAESLPALTADEAIKAASEISDVFTEWMTRVQAAPRRESLQEVIVQPAVMRADKIIRGAKTRMMDLRPLEERRFGAYNRAVEVLKEQLEQTREALLKPEVARERIQPELKMQFATAEAQKVAEARGETTTTLGGELRRRTEFLRDKMSRMQLSPKMGPAYMATRNALNRAADALDAGTVSRDLLDSVEAVVDAVAAKREIKAVDLRAINDALRAMEPTALEKIEAGQQALFTESKEEFGYIRATPANFAKSPQMKLVWAALDKAKAAQKEREEAEAERKRVQAAQIEELNTLQDLIDRIQNDTRFYFAKERKWTAPELVDAAVQYPAMGRTKEDQALVSSIVGQLTLEGQDKVRQANPEKFARYEEIIRDFRTNVIPEYNQRLADAKALLEKTGKLDDTNNRLLELMQSTNKKAREQAEFLQKVLEPLNDRVNALKTALARKGLTKEEAKLLDLQGYLREARSAYAEATKRAFDTAKIEAEQARAALLDPKIADASKELAVAKRRLERQQRLLDRIKERFETTLEKSRASNKNVKAMYELFRYEEKSGVIADLTKQIEAQEAALNDLYAQRMEDFDGSEFAKQAALDSDVKFERNLLAQLEKQLARLQGISLDGGIAGYKEEKVRDEITGEVRTQITPLYTGQKQIPAGSTMFAEAIQQLQTEIKQQQKAAATAENRAETNRTTATTSRSTLIERLQTGLGLPGMAVTFRTAKKKKGEEAGRRVAVSETRLSAEQQKAEKLRETGIQGVLERMVLDSRAKIKEARRTLLEQELLGKYDLFNFYSGPTTADEIKKEMAAPGVSKYRIAQLKKESGAVARHPVA